MDRKHTRAAAAALLAFALSLAACGGGPDAQQGRGEGTVVALDAARGEITLDHGEIPGVMGAMTMSFPVSDPKLLEGVAPGQSVEFEVEVVQGEHRVTAIRSR